jgi:glycosyltransferase involved in cell wall biosynthesis
MLIGIDGRPFYGAHAGTGRYVTELCRVLDAALPEANFLVYGNRPLELPVSNGRWRQRGDESAAAARMPSALWYFLRAGGLARHDDVDVFWGAANFLPLGLGPKIPAILTVYDFVYRLFPQTLNLTHRLAYRLFFNKSLKRARILIAISQGTSDRLSEVHERGADLVIRPRVAEHFYPPGAGVVQAARDHYGIDFPYFLSVSTLEPRKNLEALIEAFLQLRAAGELPDAGLVLVGQQGWKDRRLLDALARAKSLGVRIVQTGYVPDDWLPALYAGATAFVMPSLYEGFGMPVLEAKCCGARVVTSDIPEIREAGGDGPIYIQPTIDGIKQGLKAAVITARGDVAVDREVDRGASWAEEGGKLVNTIRSLV